MGAKEQDLLRELRMCSCLPSPHITGEPCLANTGDRAMNPPCSQARISGGTEDWSPDNTAVVMKSSVVFLREGLGGGGHWPAILRTHSRSFAPGCLPGPVLFWDPQRSLPAEPLGAESLHLQIDAKAQCPGHRPKQSQPWWLVGREQGGPLYSGLQS